jgi:hypothetical protein
MRQVKPAEVLRKKCVGGHINPIAVAINEAIIE